MMAKREGVSKFSLDFREEPCLTAEMTDSLTGWRHVLHRLGLIGQEPGRYQGYGFGNISRRWGDPPGSFIISGTQTGGAPFLLPGDYALVTACEPLTNSVSAVGTTRPSSEALTHGQLYRLDEEIGSVVHVHSPEIWRKAETLQLPVTRSEVEYGTPEMALEVERLFCTAEVRRQRIFAMGGHEDGVVGFGRDLTEACTVVIAAFVRAVVLAENRG